MMVKGRFLRACLALALATAAAVGISCSSKSNNSQADSGPPPPACDPTKCSPHNTCIDDLSGSGPTCHLTCTEQTGPDGCPFGYYCNDGVQMGLDAGNNPAYNPPAFCVQETGNGMGVTRDSNAMAPIAPWGVPCLPAGGETGNPACDSAQGFACYGVRPADPYAFCTQFGCMLDSDCPGGWWCATENTAPSVKTAIPSFGPTRTVCLPREFCSPCLADHDCTTTTGRGDGLPLHCVTEPGSKVGGMYCASVCKTAADCNQDDKCSSHWSVCQTPDSGMSCTRDEDCPLSTAANSNGNFQHCELTPVEGGFGTSGQCTPECGSDGDCDMGQHCKASAVTYCTPRAGVCKGDGTFCSPCRSDADCTDGYCMVSPYSFERFCSVKTSMPGCDPTKANPPACPMRVSGDNWKATACTMTPANQCVGLVTLGASTGMSAYLPGCWTVNQ
jgi:hypothetical protein